MKKEKTQPIYIIALMLVLSVSVFAHPTGNMISVGDHVLWSYINPVNDPNHMACVMIWNKNSNPEVFIRSEYSASDYMLYNHNDEIYIVERRHLQATQRFEVRVLKATVDTKPTVIWNWFEDNWRVGEGGFFMLSDNQMVFARYPEIYTLEKGKEPSIYFDFNRPVKRIRAVENNQILLLGDTDCYLTRQNGTIVKKWEGLQDNNVKNAPLDRNQIFDADYKKGILLYAYWGKRSFEQVDKNGNQAVILQQDEPFTPHWVAFRGNEELLFSSRLIFDGSTPKPYLVLRDENKDIEVLWSTP